MLSGSEIVLYRRHANSIGTWRIWADGSVIYYAHSVTEGGAEQVHHEVVTVNGSGRNIDQQVDLQMKSRISRMLDKGYKTDRQLALAGATNQLGLVNPMLALPIKNVTVRSLKNAYVQRKYDGHRCMITKDAGELIAYSRKGKEITQIPHVLNYLKDKIPEGVTLDGEMYRHGWTLQKIASCVKRYQPDSNEIAYHVYDIVEDASYSERYRMMCQFMPVSGPALLVPTFEVDDMHKVYTYFKQFRGEGHEGAMLRLDLRGYEDNKRTDQLLKVKEREDGEFKIIGVKEGKNSVAIFTLQLENGKTFDCLAPGPVVEKQRLWQERDKQLGRWLTVEYACKTADGIPFHCVALRFRVDI